jgi:hypothetical protein
LRRSRIRSTWSPTHSIASHKKIGGKGIALAAIGLTATAFALCLKPR